MRKVNVRWDTMRRSVTAGTLADRRTGGQADMLIRGYIIVYKHNFKSIKALFFY